MNRPNPKSAVWFKTLDANDQPVTVRLYIDPIYILHELGPKAAKSRGGKSQLMHGAIVCKREAL